MKITSQSPVQRSFSFPSSSDVSTSNQNRGIRPSELPEVGPDSDDSSSNESEQTTDSDQQSNRSNQSGSEGQEGSGTRNNGSQLPFITQPPGISQQEPGNASENDRRQNAENITSQITQDPSGNSLIPDSSPGSEGDQSGSAEQSEDSGQGVGESGDATGPFGLTPEERRRVQELKRIDQRVRAHEQAHLAAAGQYAQGGPKYEYTRGPDGKRYAVGGQVNLDTSKEESPEETIQKMRQVRSAALAPANPSPSDQQVANQASRKLNEARRKKAQQERKEQEGENQQSSGTEQASESNGQSTDGPDNNNPAQNTGEIGESGNSDDQFGEIEESDEPFGEQSDNDNQPGGIEFVEDFGDIPGNDNESNEETSVGQGENSPADEGVNGAEQSARGIEEPGQRSDEDENTQGVSEGTESEDGEQFAAGEDDNESNLPDFLTQESTRRERQNFPGQQVNLVI